MELQSRKIYYKGDREIRMDVLLGHFATNHSHVNYYLDTTKLKTRHKSAKLAAEVLVAQFQVMVVDTIICLEGTQVLGAFLAEALSQPAPMAMNSGSNINVLTPEVNVNNQLIFQKNTQGMVTDQNILLLLSTVSTGKTINRLVDCLRYYQGRLAGIGAVFSAKRENNGIPVRSIFTEEDLPNYATASPGTCAMCKENRKIDAIINPFGYTPI